MASLDSMHASDTLLSLAYLNQKAELQSNLDSLSIVAGGLSQQIYAATELLTEEAKLKYQEAAAVYTIDYNTKYTANVYLESTAKNLPINGTHLPELEAIAMQCPLAGGKAVFIARNMLQSSYPDSILLWEDEARCLAVGYDVRKMPLSNEELENEDLTLNTILLYPNPNEGQFSLLLDLANKANIVIKINDVLGKMIVAKDYTYTNQIELNLNLAKGVYLVELWQENIQIHQEKLIVK